MQELLVLEAHEVNQGVRREVNLVGQLEVRLWRVLKAMRGELGTFKDA